MQAITTETKLVPLLGKPLSHSYSVTIQNMMYEYIGYNYIRIPVEVEGEDVGHVVNGFRRMNIAGITATKPNKIELMKYLDEIDPLAQNIGAVNVSVLRDGKLIGYNTDGIGFISSLREETDCQIQDAVFFCFGVGGAGRAICTTLVHERAKKLYVADILADAAHDYAAHLAQLYPALKVEQIDLADETALRNAVSEAQVVMNISGLGMVPHLGETPIDASYFRPGQIAFDAIYNPGKTRFLQEAEKKGCHLINGKKMMAYCSMAGFELLCGHEAPKEEWLRVLDEFVSSAN